MLIVNDLDVTLSFITSQLEWKEENDVLLQPSSLNGLKKTSLIRITKITTIDADLVLGKLGKLNLFEIKELNIK